MSRDDELFQLMRDRYNSTERVFWGNDIVPQGLFPFETKLLQKYISPHSTILNVGCGGGREAFIMSQSGHRIVAVDLSESMIEHAQKNAEKYSIENIDFLLANACDLPFRDDSFDAVIAFNNLINHIPKRVNRIKALEESRRVLKKDGIFITISNSINARFIYKLYFFFVNALRSVYNPRHAERNDTIPFHTDGKFRFIRRGPYFHWYSALEFIDDLCAARLHLVDFFSSHEIENEHKDILMRESGGQICYVAKK